MSAREFATFVGVPHGTINKYRVHGLNTEYAGKPVGDPSGEFMYKLYKATHVGIDSLWKLVYPDIEAPSTESWIIADMIINLPDEQREVVETFMQGIALQIAKKER